MNVETYIKIKEEVLRQSKDFPIPISRTILEGFFRKAEKKVKKERLVDNIGLND